ncbi:hypothetical protein TREMEDRAFT_58710 [Tremella mesenterica DSM 1558]|uniref:uncharacterized protein n=1 Tax=Tremella mesenterica (strain ATCC 24925 / CBS 8224 / DSM 1558 / NBRC 9311 / NRRL Y-6157 / RJB 2259-6 / UBC 559-6) TaxID=578456 RepID=UPI0003F48E1C|nr:uncharacterized protein TREMEDRAFT_58710 [Tremella mesenterica DSM 1558]EIW72538.1 hypothetical protein TREMEDRAFT_58710 [Tremella mesenterica DSM 1558]
MTDTFVDDPDNNTESYQFVFEDPGSWPDRRHLYSVRPPTVNVRNGISRSQQELIPGRVSQERRPISNDQEQLSYQYGTTSHRNPTRRVAQYSGQPSNEELQSRLGRPTITFENDTGIVAMSDHRRRCDLLCGFSDIVPGELYLHRESGNHRTTHLLWSRDPEDAQLETCTCNARYTMTPEKQLEFSRKDIPFSNSSIEVSYQESTIPPDLLDRIFQTAQVMSNVEVHTLDNYVGFIHSPSTGNTCCRSNCRFGEIRPGEISLSSREGNSHLFWYDQGPTITDLALITCHSVFNLVEVIERGLVRGIPDSTY